MLPEIDRTEEILTPSQVGIRVWQIPLLASFPILGRLESRNWVYVKLILHFWKAISSLPELDLVLFGLGSF